MAKRAGEDSVHHDLEGQTQKYRNVGDCMDSNAQWIDLRSIQNEGKQCSQNRDTYWFHWVSGFDIQMTGIIEQNQRYRKCKCDWMRNEVYVQCELKSNKSD
jgi:hypothetical protein